MTLDQMINEARDIAERADDDLLQMIERWERGLGDASENRIALREATAAQTHRRWERLVEQRRHNP